MVKDEPIPPKAGKIKKLRIHTKNKVRKLQKLIIQHLSKIIFGDNQQKLSTEEVEKLQQEIQKNKMNAKLEFDQSEEDDREGDLDDIQIYLARAKSKSEKTPLSNLSKFERKKLLNLIK